MQKIFLHFKYAFISTLIVLSACGTPLQNQKVTQTIEKYDSSVVEGVHQYKIYIPAHSTDCHELPLVLIIDPHAEASNALAEFIRGAKKYKFILVASATLKNNYPDFAHTINLLLDDIRLKYPVSQSVYIAGFSGGARMALNYAQYMPVDGVIACGALASREQISAINCPVFAIAGLGDFNFIETAQYIFKPEEAPANLRLEITENVHTWPSDILLCDILGYLHVTDQHGSSWNNQKRQLKQFASEQKIFIDSLKEGGDLLNASLTARNLVMIKGINKQENFALSQYEIESSVEYKAELDQLKESIRFELAVRNAYNSALQSNDSAWWAKEISSLMSKIDEDKDYFRSMAYQRIKGFIGIMCYTLSSNSLRLNDLKNTERILSIYRLAEPENSDMLYFYALYYERINEPDKAIEYLSHAIKAGYSDITRIAEDFSETTSQEVMPLIPPENR
jgi:hypothetical protein